jgi:hypothetical protein
MHRASFVFVLYKKICSTQGPCATLLHGSGITREKEKGRRHSCENKVWQHSSQHFPLTSGHAEVYTFLDKCQDLSTTANAVVNPKLETLNPN